MKVNFASPGSSSRTAAGDRPGRPVRRTPAAEGRSCIPQPGTANLRPAVIADRLMFRAAYRNYIDHESLVVSHSVDPSRQRSASPASAGTTSVSRDRPTRRARRIRASISRGRSRTSPNGRSRWMSSIAMDSAENILVGYSTTGKTERDREPQHRATPAGPRGIRPGSMTVPETTIVTGTAQQHQHRFWGDYSEHERRSVRRLHVLVRQPVLHEANKPGRPVSRRPPFRRGAEPGSASPRRAPRVPAALAGDRHGDGPRRQPDHRDLDGHHADAGRLRHRTRGWRVRRRGALQAARGRRTATTYELHRHDRAGRHQLFLPRARGRRRRRPVPSSSSRADASTPRRPGRAASSRRFAGAGCAASSPGTNCGVTVGWTAAVSTLPADAEHALQRLPRDGARFRPSGCEPDRDLRRRPELVSRHRQPAERNDLLLRRPGGGRQHRERRRVRRRQRRVEQRRGLGRPRTVPARRPLPAPGRTAAATASAFLRLNVPRRRGTTIRCGAS